MARTTLFPRATVARSARDHHEDIGSERAYLLGDLRLRARTDSNHCDDGCNADDNPEHRQEAAHLVGTQGPQRDAEALQDHHAAAALLVEAPSTASRSSTACASRGSATPMSATSAPSCSRNIRRA